MLAIKLYFDESKKFHSIRRHSSQIGYVFFTIRSQKSRDALIAREWNDGISRTITSKISKLTVFPLPRTERGEETYTCTYRHRSGLDIA